jgi:thioredoxin reductase (NADPH)
MDQRNKVTIIGAGPAGLAAAMYLQRAELHPTILEKDKPGGLLRNAYLVENYPGFPGGIKGCTLTDLFVEQLHTLGLVITKSVVTHVSCHNDTFVIETDHGRLVSSAIIITTGTIPRTLEIPGSTSIAGTRLFHEPQSLPLKENGEKKRILVIGGGDIALDYTLTLLNWGYIVTIISRSEPTCLPLLQKRALKNGASIRTMYVPEKIVEHNKDILLRCRHNNTAEELSADFILVACGRDPNTSFLTPNLKKCINDVSECSQTSLPGLYFAGDVVRGTYRQAGIAVGDGIHAAMMVERFLRNKLVRP